MLVVSKGRLFFWSFSHGSRNLRGICGISCLRFGVFSVVVSPGWLRGFSRHTIGDKIVRDDILKR